MNERDMVHNYGPSGYVSPKSVEEKMRQMADANDGKVALANRVHELEAEVSRLTAELAARTEERDGLREDRKKAEQQRDAMAVYAMHIEEAALVYTDGGIVNGFHGSHETDFKSWKELTRPDAENPAVILAARDASVKAEARAEVERLRKLCGDAARFVAATMIICNHYPEDNPVLFTELKAEAEKSDK